MGLKDFETINFDDIRPYEDNELQDVLQRLFADPSFRQFGVRVLGQEQFDIFEKHASEFESVQQFQKIVIYPFLNHLITNLATSLEYFGIDKSVSDGNCIYMSNHRDIVIDVALLDKFMLEHIYPTVEIGIGDNLLIYPWIKDLVRLNRAFIVRRGESGKELLLQSKHLSEYIHFAICSKHKPIWIAQREGRAKDSNDHTQESVLKMLAMGSDKSFCESLKELHIHPLSISYEYDPCDYLKAKEFQLKRDNPNYKKTQADDLLNMRTGIMGYKGRIIYDCAECINPMIDTIAQQTDNRNEQATLIAREIDKQIFSHYHLYEINYIAMDMLSGDNVFANKYSKNQSDSFAEYLHAQINKIDIENKDEAFLRDMMLRIYANPAKNKLGLL